MAAHTADNDFPPHGCRHSHAGLHGELPDINIVVHMYAEYRIHILHCAAEDHVPCVYAYGRFLAGLEDQVDLTAEGVLSLTQDSCRCQQGGCMAVVPAQMRCALYGGAIFAVRLFLNGKGIHIRTQRNRFSRLAAVYDAQYTLLPDPVVGNAPAIQAGSDLVRCTDDLIARLGVLMQIPTHSYRVLKIPLRCFFNAERIIAHLASPRYIRPPASLPAESQPRK